MWIGTHPKPITSPGELVYANSTCAVTLNAQQHRTNLTAEPLVWPVLTLAHHSPGDSFTVIGIIRLRQYVEMRSRSGVHLAAAGRRIGACDEERRYIGEILAVVASSDQTVWEGGSSNSSEQITGVTGIQDPRYPTCELLLSTRDPPDTGRRALFMNCLVTAGHGSNNSRGLTTISYA